MKSVLISIQPKWVEKICKGEKTIEVRKSKPKLETPFKCYIYETKGKKVECGFHFEDTGRTLREKYVFGMHEAKIVKHYCNEGQGKVIGEFVCDEIELVDKIYSHDLIQEKSKIRNIIQNACIEAFDLLVYLGYDTKDKKPCYAWHISNLKIYDKPKELGEFTPFCKFKNERCELCICYEEVFGGCCRVLKRPPQSWCYVEEKQDER